MITPYCTLSEAKTELKATSAVDDALLRQNIRRVSRRIDQLMNGRRQRPYFAPWIEQREFEVSMRRIDSHRNILWLDEPLLAYTGVLLGAEDITSLVEAYPSLASPIQALRFTSVSRSWYEKLTNSNPVSYVKVTGTWGWHSDYDNAWASVDALVSDMETSDTTISVADVDEADLYGFTPRLSAGNLLKVGDEFLEALETDTTANTADVKRGVNGSTQATSTISSGEAVYTWQVDEAIKRATMRQAALLYARRGSFQVETVDPVGTISYPQDLLSELRGIVQEFHYA